MRVLQAMERAELLRWLAVSALSGVAFAGGFSAVVLLVVGVLFP